MKIISRLLRWLREFLSIESEEILFDAGYNYAITELRLRGRSAVVYLEKALETSSAFGETDAFDRGVKKALENFNRRTPNRRT